METYDDIQLWDDWYLEYMYKKIVAEIERRKETKNEIRSRF